MIPDFQRILRKKKSFFFFFLPRSKSQDSVAVISSNCVLHNHSTRSTPFQREPWIVSEPFTDLYIQTPQHPHPISSNLARFMRIFTTTTTSFRFSGISSCRPMSPNPWNWRNSPTQIPVSLLPILLISIRFFFHLLFTVSVEVSTVSSSITLFLMISNFLSMVFFLSLLLLMGMIYFWYWVCVLGLGVLSGLRFRHILFMGVFGCTPDCGFFGFWTFCFHVSIELECEHGIRLVMCSCLLPLIFF